MNRMTIAGGFAVALVVAFGTVAAQAGAIVVDAEERVLPERIALDREGVIEVILGTWEGSEHAMDGEGRLWRDAMRPVLEAADEANLRRAMDALEFPAMLAALEGRIESAGVAPAALGSPSSDLVYTPIVPCRILDTRQAGGAIAADTSRSFDASAFSNGSFEFQGGSDTDCGIPLSRPAAVMMNITVVNPQGAGYLTAYPWGPPQPFAASLNYATGAVVGNEVLVTTNPSGVWDFRIYTYRQAHVVADAVGYFMAPEVTALDCQLVETSAGIVSMGSAFQTSLCPSGFRATGGGCYWFAAADHGTITSFVNASLTGHTCHGRNQTGSSQTLYSRATCCRIPGR